MPTLLKNGRIYTPWSPGATALLIERGRLAWLGDEATAASMVADEVIDLAGALVTPAFVDAHCHLTDTGRALTGLDLAGCGTLAEALAAVEQFARAGAGRPVLGSGWDETRWPERRAPTARELDRAGYGGLVYLARTDAHSAVVSSALMASVAGLPGLDGYAPTGQLTRAAHHAVREVALGSISPGQRAELQRVALRRAAALGVAAVHEMAGPEISSAEDLAGLLALVAAEPDLPEVYGYWGQLGGVQAARELGAIGAGGDLFCDGSIGSHTAGMREPYLDADTSGYLRFATAELAEHIVECTEAGLQAGFHAIGDAATDQVVAAMRMAIDKLGPRVSAAGHRIEHAELVTDLAAFAEVGLVASVQPAFDASWGGEHGMYAERLGADRAGRLNPLAGFAAAGVPLALGADSPVTPIDPWGAVRAAAYPHFGRHALSVRAAMIAHTRGGWRAAGADGDGSGMLAPGTPATFAVFDAGPAAEGSGPSGLPGLDADQPLPRCLRTVLRGRVLFDSGELR
ncbi:MAG: amidohydrolase family protein [Jatrophihabitantaceae bacterium]